MGDEVRSVNRETGSEKRGLRVGVALSGGVVRGPAHIGVLRVLERNRIPIHCMAGVSAGAIIGAAYCAGLGVEQLREIALHMRWRDIARPVLSRQGLVSFDKMERYLIDLVGDLTFDDLRIPFAVQATDLESGEPVVLREGRLAPAVRASCSVPGFVVPVEINGRLLVDGGASNNLPATAARGLGAAYVIGVDLFRASVRWGWGPLGIGFGSIERLIRASGGGLEAVDCLISPDLEGMSYLRFSQAQEMIARGERAAQEKLDEIRAALGEMG